MNGLKMFWASVLTTAMVGLTACGGSSNTTPAPPVASTNVAKVVIDQASVLVTGVGKTQTLTAKALDASGNAVSATISFSSSKPENATVNGSGVVTGVAVGSSQITASVGDVKSPPIMAAVATLTTDTADITQDNIVSGPNFINVPEGQAPTVGSQYTAVVRNLTPTVGRKWFSQGANGQRLQGQIVSVADAAGGNKLVTLEVVPYDQIFSALVIDEELDFSTAPDTVPPAVEEQGVGSQAFVGFGALECELSNVGGTLPITLSVPSMSIGFNTDTARTGIRINIGFGQPNIVEARFRGTLNANLAFSGRINRNISGAVDCRTRNPITRGIANIPLPLFTSLTSERGLGVKFSGDFSGPSTSFEASGNLSVTLDMGARINLGTGAINQFNNITPSVNGLLRFTQPNQITTFEASAEAYVFDNWILNGPGFSFDMWVDRNGVRSVSNMISVPQQITSGQRTTQRLERVGRNGPGREFDNFLRFFNIRELLPSTRTYTDTIRAAPFTLSTFGCNVLNSAPTRAFCTFQFSSVDYTGLTNNIFKTEIWVRRGSAAPFRAAEDTNPVGTGGEFTLTAPDITLQSGDQCFLVVYPRSLIFAGFVTLSDSNCLAN